MEKSVRVILKVAVLIYDYLLDFEECEVSRFLIENVSGVMLFEISLSSLVIYQT